MTSQTVGPARANRRLANRLGAESCGANRWLAIDCEPGQGRRRPGLTTTQIETAIEYYRSRTDVYTPEVVAALRRRLGLGADGGADAALVRAVASRQTADWPKPASRP